MSEEKRAKKLSPARFEQKISRRDLLKTTALTLGSAALPVVSCSGGKVPPRKIRERVIILGFDAVSPVLLREFMDRGLLPNLEKLARDGTFTEITSSIPPESPVAWSTFSVSAQAGVHGIYDFLNRDLQTYNPRIASVKPVYPKFLWDLIPLGRPQAIKLQTGKPFWVQAAEHGIKSAMLEAPVAFPAYEVEAESLLLSGLTTPDIRGTQATYHFFTTDIYSENIKDTEFGGKLSVIEFDSHGRAESTIVGPWNPITRQKRARLMDELAKRRSQGAIAAELVDLNRALDRLEKEDFLTVPVVFTLQGDRSRVTIELQDQKITLARGEWSDWIEIEFSLNFLIQLKGITRFIPMEVGGDVKIFMSPIEIHPDEPVLPISYPPDFSARLARKIGLYKTRGWAAETAALKELKLDDKAFMEDLDLIIDKREAMAFEILEHERPNLFLEVFSCPDRVQHMFWSLVDKGHPAYDKDRDKEFGNAVLHVYQRMDTFLGKVRQRFEDEDTFLIVMSDHGFSSFRKGVNLNTWLVKNGYMKLKGQDDPRYNLKDLFGGGDFFVNVDWSGTRAYSVGLGLIFINLKAREAQGIVEPGQEYDTLVREIAGRLKDFRDPEDGVRVVHNVYLGREVYHGPRIDEAPDLVLGFNQNYRVSWQTALGGVPPEVIEPNMEKWSGDHCSVDRDLVPGVFLTNRKISLPDPDLRDVAPTVLKYLGCPVPAEYEGRDLFEKPAV
ncbi:MAG TPA: alkaline phosphatase family protein [archaeon]|nr:alkaline phosphatase family protein [archaeon]